MHVFRFDRSYILVLLIGILAIEAAIFAVGYATRFRHFAGENQTAETWELIVLGVAVLGYGWLIFRVKHAARIVAAGAMSLCILFFFREFEAPVRDPVLIFMSKDPFLYILAGILGAFLAVQFWLNWAHVPAFLGWLVRFGWWPFLLAGICFLIGEAFEQAHVVIVEESFELAGFAILAVTAGTALHRTRRAARAAALRPA